MKRARNQEVIRQWKLMREVESARFGKTVDDLARSLDVTTRTIRRDIAALQEAGFPLEDHRRDGKTIWKLNRDAFREGLIAAGFTLSELAALYFSRALLEYLAGAPFQDDLQSAFDKFEDVLTSEMRDYLDALPDVLTAKSEPTKRRDSALYRDVVRRLTTAAIQHRRVKMRYFSFHSAAEKAYTVEPYQLAYGQGGLYLIAYVPEYRQVRTFAVERLRQLTVLDERFDPVHRAGEAFADSIGINSGGRPEPVCIEFSPTAAAYIRERRVHKSQRVEELGDGSLKLHLQVAADWALIAWILSYGPLARVVSPGHLAARIFARLEEARLLYAPQMPLEPPARHARLEHPALPFRRPLRASRPVRRPAATSTR